MSNGMSAGVHTPSTPGRGATAGHVRRRSSVANAQVSANEHDTTVTFSPRSGNRHRPSASFGMSSRSHVYNHAGGNSSGGGRTGLVQRIIDAVQSSTDPARLSLLLHAAGLIVIYSLYGVLQEKIMRSSTYGPDNEHFTSSSLLIVANRLFSITTGAAILWYKSRQMPERGSFSQRLRPASPFFAYASVACFNFLSTTCQYEALKYVSYTTQSLAKTSKMIPVLVVGALVWKKQHKTREWIAGGVILLGCATYLFSAPPRISSHATAKPDDDGSFFSGLIGAFFLIGYLFFDGLVSTTQEKVFGKNPSSSDPFGPESPVLDQMIWTNVFACAIAIVVAVLSNATGALLPNIRLLLTSPALIWDVVVFSGASAIGLIILLNTIASFGALTSSLIMTIRQFLSILINAGIFGNFSTVSIEGWCGVGWVASGIWIKINKKYDPPKRSAKAGPIEGGNREELEVLVEKNGTSGHSSSMESRSKLSIYLWQYFVPVLVPVALAIIVAMFALPTGALTSTGVISSAASKVEDWTKFDLLGGESDRQEEAKLADADVDEIRQVLGGKWDAELHQAVSPECEHDIVTRPYNGSIRTGFVSYPRSGNSYMRSLIERSTRYQTSSVYCDHGLAQTFVGECDRNATFFVKTHFPALPRVYTAKHAGYYKQFDQVVHLIRNPLDSISSWYHLNNAPRTSQGWLDHEHKVDLPGGKFGQLQHKELVDMAERWARHALYWAQAPILTHTLRYEDLKATPIPKMMSLLSFLLPDEHLPPLSDLACVVEANNSHQPYRSRRMSDFASWDLWEPEIRMEVLRIVRRPFCAAGYLSMLRNAKGDLPEMQGFCDDVDFQSKVEIKDVKSKPNGDIWR